MLSEQEIYISELEFYQDFRFNQYEKSIDRWSAERNNPETHENEKELYSFLLDEIGKEKLMEIRKLEKEKIVFKYILGI